jgi:hypothetical protein
MVCLVCLVSNSDDLFAGQPGQGSQCIKETLPVARGEHGEQSFFLALDSELGRLAHASARRCELEQVDAPVLGVGRAPDQAAPFQVVAFRPRVAPRDGSSQLDVIVSMLGRSPEWPE